MKSKGILKNLINRRGFTFIELLIAMTIFTIIATVIYSSLRAGIRVWNRSNQTIEEFQSMRVFFAMVSSDLRNAVVFDPEGANFYGRPAMMTFMTLVTAAGKERTGDRELAKVTYYLDGRTLSVMRRVAGKPQGFDLDKAGAVSILTGIGNRDISFEYYYKAAAAKDGYEWKNKWENTNKIPLGVRIKVSDFTRYIFIPTGSVQKEKKK